MHLTWTAAKNMEHDYDIDEESNKAEFMQYNLDGKHLSAVKNNLLPIFYLSRYNKSSIQCQLKSLVPEI